MRMIFKVKIFVPQHIPAPQGRSMLLLALGPQKMTVSMQHSGPHVGQRQEGRGWGSGGLFQEPLKEEHPVQGLVG